MSGGIWINCVRGAQTHQGATIVSPRAWPAQEVMTGIGPLATRRRVQGGKIAEVKRMHSTFVARSAVAQFSCHSNRGLDGVS